MDSNNSSQLKTFCVKAHAIALPLVDVCIIHAATPEEAVEKALRNPKLRNVKVFRVYELSEPTDVGVGVHEGERVTYIMD